MTVQIAIMPQGKLINNIHYRLIFAIILLAPLFYLGIGNKYPWIFLGENGHAIGILLFFCFTLTFFGVALLSVTKQISAKVIRNFFITHLFLSVIVAIAYDLIQYKHFASIGYQKPLLLYILAAILLIALIFFKNKLNVLLILCGLYNILHTLGSIYYFPLISARSDMLAAIALSISNFLHNCSPYAHSATNIGVPPYLPITMLSFLPAVLCRVDLRLIGLFYWLSAIILLYWKQNQLNTVQKMAVALLSINPYFLMRHDLYYQFFLLEIVIICLYFNSFNFIAKGLSLGVFIATLQFAWLLVPFILLAENKSRKSFILMTLFAVLSAGVLVLLYIHHGIGDFINAVFRSHREYVAAYASDITFGLATIFYFAQEQILLYALQIIGCLITLGLALYIYLRKSIYWHSYYMSLGAFCYLYFMITNYFMETYLYLPMLLFIILTYKDDNLNWSRKKRCN